LSTDNLDEFIELRNITSAAIALYDPLHPENTWKIDGGVEYIFRPGITVPPLGYVLLVHFDPEHDPVMLNSFRSRFAVSTNTPIYGPFTGNLANEGDRIGIYQPDKPQGQADPNPGFVPYLLVEEVNYSNVTPWPVGADGTGNSLQRIASITFADEPTNWIAAVPTAGRLNVGANLVDTDHDGLPDEWELANGLDPNSAAGANGPSADPDGDGMNNYQEFIAGTNPLDGTDVLQFGPTLFSANNCVLTFNSKSGKTYTIEMRDSLDPSASWAPLFSNISGTGSPIVLNDSVGSVGRFYRIRVN
jgi:hypothetical protein